VKRSVGIPVVGSGDVVSVATARARWERGVDALAIGRGAMESPWLFSQIAADWRGETSRGAEVADRLRALRRYRELLDEVYPEKVTAARLRGMACRMAKGFPGSAALREVVSRTRSSRELLDVLDRFEVLQAAMAESHRASASAAPVREAATSERPAA
jgi:tRNA-dihydrouridine synthase